MALKSVLSDRQLIKKRRVGSAHRPFSQCHKAWTLSGAERVPASIERRSHTLILLPILNQDSHP
jgi:hypothetical protein